MNTKYAYITTAIAMCIISLFGCTSDNAFTPKTSHQKLITLSGHTFTVEIADDEAERQQGLMHRTELAADHGMLFIFNESQRVAFWMKNTLIPLDILYFDSERRLTQIFAETPPCRHDPCAIYPSANDNTHYVLELGSGMAKTIGARIGDEFTREMQ